MLTNDEVKEIILKDNLTDIEELEVIRRYIYDQKNVDVGDINRPKNMIQLQLLSIAYNSAVEFYYDKLINLHEV